MSIGREGYLKSIPVDGDHLLVDGSPRLSQTDLACGPWALVRGSGRTSDLSLDGGPAQRKGVWTGLPRVTPTPRLFLKPQSLPHFGVSSYLPNRGTLVPVSEPLFQAYAYAGKSGKLTLRLQAHTSAHKQGALFGYLHKIAMASKRCIGALMASRFCERINSQANLTLTRGNTWLSDEEMEN